ncbi:VOC family protein [Myceligenerans salitolerans]|uniref:VOC family protein n=1 Tax=Myceligenerans salitolerans TaxID=1230528 RepID=A0ABS3IAP0_9MICO|nr:VOC family protein [Myceligenerans salitolerans]MBO0609508.1 VOC family protein [Myceligenerans salitolerans]
MTETRRPGIARMGSVVLDVPDLSASARFWTAMTSGKVVREDDDWVSTRTSDGWALDFQFAPDLVPPNWPGQDRPQQVHLDLRTPDVAAATQAAVARGATVLRESAEWTTLADPAGHPFDLCVAEDNPGTTVMGLTFDVPDSHAAARFWSALIGEPVVYDQDGMAMTGGDRPLLFQQVENYTPPAWPDPARPQQGHLDVFVDDLDAAEEATLALGATRLPDNGETFRVFADPAGHPFCLCLNEE